MISTSDFKKGATVELDGSLYRMEDVHHVKTKKSAVYRVKLRDLRAGHITERTFNAGDKIPVARVERRKMQYLYGDGESYTFMNSETFDQVMVPRAVIQDALPYIRESDEVQVILHGDEALGVELPAAVELQITQSDPGVKGDTATGATKPATVETGLVVNVPLFLDVGDVVKVSTTDGKYLERVKAR
ncbi:MAG: elongation factor P [Dehalococcoidia bacterium]